MDNKLNGKGVMERKDGEKYCGEFKDNQYHGLGTLISKDGVFEGQFENGKHVGENNLFD